MFHASYEASPVVVEFVRRVNAHVFPRGWDKPAAGLGRVRAAKIEKDRKKRHAVVYANLPENPKQSRQVKRRLALFASKSKRAATKRSLMDNKVPGGSAALL